MYTSGYPSISDGSNILVTHQISSNHELGRETMNEVQYTLSPFWVRSQFLFYIESQDFLVNVSMVLVLGRFQQVRCLFISEFSRGMSGK